MTTFSVDEDVLKAKECEKINLKHVKYVDDGCLMIDEYTTNQKAMSTSRTKFKWNH
jgi:hypothetical protein